MFWRLLGVLCLRLIVVVYWFRFVILFWWVYFDCFVHLSWCIGGLDGCFWVYIIVWFVGFDFVLILDWMVALFNCLCVDAFGWIIVYALVYVCGMLFIFWFFCLLLGFDFVLIWLWIFVVCIAWNLAAWLLMGLLVFDWLWYSACWFLYACCCFVAWICWLCV